MEYRKQERTVKNHKFTVVVCCMGQPFDYQYKTLVGALFAYAWHYLKKNKYNTMNFTLKDNNRG